MRERETETRDPILERRGGETPTLTSDLYMHIYTHVCTLRHKQAHSYARNEFSILYLKDLTLALMC